MTVTDEQVATLRAYLAQDFEEYHRLRDQLDEQELNGYAALLTGGFFEAVDRRFVADGTSAEDAEVIEFVADVRARFDEDGETLDPRIAERLIWHSLGKGSIADIDDTVRGSAQMILLAALSLDERFDDAELDAFLATARGLGERLLS